MVASRYFTSSVSRIFWNFLPFWLFLVVYKFGAGLHYTLISPFGESLFPLWVVGILMGATSIVQVFLDVPAGYVLDRFGYRKFLGITTFVFLLAGICFMFGLTKTTYLISLAISTFGWLFYGPGINAYILSHAPKESAGKFISLRDVFGSVGIVLSSAFLPLVLMLTVQNTGFFLSLLLFSALILIMISPKDHESVHREKKLDTHHHHIRRTPFLSTVKMMKKLNPASSMLVALNCVAGIFYGAIWFVVPLVIAHQANSGLLSIGLSIFDFAVVVLGFTLGSLADRSNKRTLVFFGILLFALSGMLIGFNFSWIFLLFGFLATTGDEMAGIALWSWLHSLDKEHAHDGAVSGVINLFSDLGWALGPVFAGILYSIIGPSWTILCGAVPIFLTWILYQFFIRKYPHTVDLSLIPRKPHRLRHRS